MTTVLQYLVIAAVIGLLLFGVALLLFGRGERLSALPARTSPAQLPERGIDGADVRRVRFALALRGYRMSDVDWTLERLADELDRTHAELAGLKGESIDGAGAGTADGYVGDPAGPSAADRSDPEVAAVDPAGDGPTATGPTAADDTSAGPAAADATSAGPTAEATPATMAAADPEPTDAGDPDGVSAAPPRVRSDARQSTYSTPTPGSEA